MRLEKLSKLGRSLSCRRIDVLEDVSSIHERERESETNTVKQRGVQRQTVTQTHSMAARRTDKDRQMRWERERRSMWSPFCGNWYHTLASLIILSVLRQLGAHCLAKCLLPLPISLKTWVKLFRGEFGTRERSKH